MNEPTNIKKEKYKKLGVCECDPLILLHKSQSKVTVTQFKCLLFDITKRKLCLMCQQT